MFPVSRPRRLRRTAAVREMVRETRLRPAEFVYPLFACPGTGVRREIPSMPGVFNLSVDRIVEEVGAMREDGVKATILFGIPEHKDEQGSDGWNDEAPVQRAVKAIKKAYNYVVLRPWSCLWCVD